ncbi:MAG: ATP synthase F0 subunit B [Candidatus Cybelea sp.]
MSDSKLYFEIAVWSQIVSSIVFIGVLVYMWFKWLLPVFMAAQERSNRQIAEAERHRDEVKAALEMLRSEIDTARHDATLIEGRAGARAEHERQTLLQETTDAGERALADAARELERARTAARQRLRDDLVERALELARQEATQRVGPALDARLVDRFADSLESVAHG